METGKQNRKLGVFMYEMIGTAFIMFTFMIDRASGFTGYPAKMTFAMMVLAWEVSGGHFNPTVSVGVFVAEKDYSNNAGTLLIMILGQVVGAVLGWGFGYFALIDVTY